jgi:hypothetical protein
LAIAPAGGVADRHQRRRRHRRSSQAPRGGVETGPPASIASAMTVGVPPSAIRLARENEKVAREARVVHFL